MARKTANIRSMTAGELAQAPDDAKEELFNLRFQWESGQLEDYTRIRQLKKDVARYLTCNASANWRRRLSRRNEMTNNRRG